MFVVITIIVSISQSLQTHVDLIISFERVNIMKSCSVYALRIENGLFIGSQPKVYLCRARLKWFLKSSYLTGWWTIIFMETQVWIVLQRVEYWIAPSGH